MRRKLSTGAKSLVAHRAQKIAGEWPYNKMKVTIDFRELSTILAALRFWQQENVSQSGSPLREIATEDGAFSALSNREIDDLAERINGGDDV